MTKTEELSQVALDYLKAEEFGLNAQDRWGGTKHHPMSKRLLRFLEIRDLNDYGNYFG